MTIISISECIAQLACALWSIRQSRKSLLIDYNLFFSNFHQTSFILRRHIIKNIVVAQKVIHSMRRKTGRRDQMMIIVDSEEAHDRLGWRFIHETLFDLGLPYTFIQIIIECIIAARINVLRKGELTEDFWPSRRIRQGDPISSYIFILCIERLSHGIYHAVKK